MPSRALVLAGGGVAGIGWLVGLATGLRERGVDLAAVDRLIGTSAGSVVAVQLATGRLRQAQAMQLSETTTELMAVLDIEEFTRLMSAAAADASSRQDAVRRLASIPRLDTSVSPEARRAVVAARVSGAPATGTHAGGVGGRPPSQTSLPVRTWPDGPLEICVVDQQTGERVVLDATSGYDLVDVVAASCAVPGVWPSVVLGDRRYVDGGTWSLSNADVAAGTDRTVIVIPTVLVDPQAAVLADEQEQLRPGSSLVVRADEESIAAFGSNPLDPATRAPAYHAGVRQAATVVDDLRAFWAD